MARITKPLTNTEVKQTKPKVKVYTLADGGGLQLRIKPNDSKLWLLNHLQPYTNKRTWKDSDLIPMCAINHDPLVMEYFPATGNHKQTRDHIKCIQTHQDK